MTTTLKATKRDELELLAGKAYNATKEGDGMHRGFSSAEYQISAGKLECRAVPSQSRVSMGLWFSYRYYLNGKAIAKKNLPNE